VNVDLFGLRPFAQLGFPKSFEGVHDMLLKRTGENEKQVKAAREGEGSEEDDEAVTH
jgi:hypothetical protein